MHQNNSKYYKGKYFISFYTNEDDEQFVNAFDNVKQICKFKNKEITAINLNLITVELNRALHRPGQTTRMLNGEIMRVYLVDIEEDD